MSWTWQIKLVTFLHFQELALLSLDWFSFSSGGIIVDMEPPSLNKSLLTIFPPGWEEETPQSLPPPPRPYRSAKFGGIPSIFFGGPNTRDSKSRRKRNLSPTMTWIYLLKIIKLFSRVKLMLVRSFSINRIIELETGYFDMELLIGYGPNLKIVPCKLYSHSLVVCNFFSRPI